jgi:hypothetical protein
MKMFLTRIGEHCRIVVNGDIRQSDIRGQNGLADAVNRVAGLRDVYVHEFSRDDIVRSGLVRDLMDRYEPQNCVELVRSVRPVPVVVSCGLRVAGYELRVMSCELRVARSGVFATRHSPLATHNSQLFPQPSAYRFK